MPPPGTLMTPVFTFGSIETNIVPTMLPSDCPTKAMREPSKSTPAETCIDGTAWASAKRSATPSRRLSREVSRLERLMNQLPEEQRAQFTAGSLFFFRRVDDRFSEAEIEARIQRESEAIATQDRAALIRACGDFMSARGRVLTAIGTRAEQRRGAGAEH